MYNIVLHIYVRCTQMYIYMCMHVWICGCVHMPGHVCEPHLRIRVAELVPELTTFKRGLDPKRPERTLGTAPVLEGPRANSHQECRVQGLRVYCLVCFATRAVERHPKAQATTNRSVTAQLARHGGKESPFVHSA